MLVTSRDVPTLDAAVRATVRAPAVLRVTLQSITTGSPPQPVDLGRVSGTITVAANVDVPAARRVELSLAGRRVETTELAGTTGPRQLAFVVNTAARDTVTGAPLYPNGPQPLMLTVASRQPALVGGCPDMDEAQALTQSLTLANAAAAVGRAP